MKNGSGSKASPPLGIAAQGPHIVLPKRLQARFRIDLCCGQMKVSKKLLHLVDRHLAGIEKDRRNRVTKQVRVDPFNDSGRESTPFDHRLHAAHRISLMAVALEQPPLTAVLQMVSG